MLSSYTYIEKCLPAVQDKRRTRQNVRWSTDFVPDSLLPFRCFRELNDVDDYSKESIAQFGDTSV